MSVSEFEAFFLHTLKIHILDFSYLSQRTDGMPGLMVETVPLTQKVTSSAVFCVFMPSSSSFLLLS